MSLTLRRAITWSKNAIRQDSDGLLDGAAGTSTGSVATTSSSSSWSAKFARVPFLCCLASRLQSRAQDLQVSPLGPHRRPQDTKCTRCCWQ